MTPRELAGKLLVGIGGPTLTTAERDWLAHYRPAGVVLFSRNVTDNERLRELCHELHVLLGPAAEIVADHEGGPISVLAAALGRPPAPWTLGRVDDCDLTRAVHRATGERLRTVGIDRLLGPCCDVLVERRNPVIGARSFGTQSDRVARHVAAAVTGLREAHIRCCLKHWPGHGGSSVDSHDQAVATAAGDIAAPFLGGWQAGADALMIGHLPWSATDIHRPAADDPAALDPATLDPATLDPEALTAARSGAPAEALLYADDATMGALRIAMSRRGIAIEDGRQQGLVDPATLPGAWLTALLRAGCDRLLIRGIPWAACPLDGHDGAEHGSAPAARQDAVAQDEPQSYRQARTQAIDPNWTWEPADALLWIDATTGDRWGSADTLEPLLAGRFPTRARILLPTDAPARSTHRAGPVSESTTESTPPSWPNLLVTSHRPLDGERFAEAVLGAGCAPQGACLVMGHPSLSDHLNARLGPRWRVEAVYDTAPADLAPTLLARR